MSITEELRIRARGGHEGSKELEAICEIAADEIERLRAALSGCVEHMEYSTPQGRGAFNIARNLLSPERTNGQAEK